MENKRRSSSSSTATQRKSKKDTALRKAKSVPKTKSQPLINKKSQGLLEDGDIPTSLSTKKPAKSVTKTKSSSLTNKKSQGLLVYGATPASLSKKKSKSSRSVKSLSRTSKISVVDEASNPNVSVQNDELDGTHLEFCKDIMNEFKEEALDTCSVRHFDCKGSDLVCFDLRDTWLRIMEQQWMDTSDLIISKPMMLDNLDEGPLPALHFDMWARGTLEVLPDKLPESFTTPFIEIAEQKQGHKIASSNSSFLRMDGSGDGLQAESDSTGISATATGSQKLSATLRLPNASTSRRDSQISDTRSVSAFATLTSLEDADKASQKMTKLRRHTMLAADLAEEMPVSEEVSEIGSVSTSMSITPAHSAKSVSRLDEILTLKAPPASFSPSSSQSSQTKRKLRPWTISQCGGRDGSGGVFRLKNQTTSEAIALLSADKASKSEPLDFEDIPITQISTPSNKLSLQVAGLDDNHLGLRLRSSRSVINITGHESFKEFGEFLNPTDNDTDTLYENNGDNGLEEDATSYSISEISSYVDLKSGHGEDFVDIYLGSILDNYPEDADEGAVTLPVPVPVPVPRSLKRLPLEDKVGRIHLWGANNIPRVSRVSDKAARLEMNTLTAKMIQSKPNQTVELEKSQKGKLLDTKNAQKKTIPGHESSSKYSNNPSRAEKPIRKFLVTSRPTLPSKDNDKPISERELVNQRIAISHMRINLIKNHRSNLRARISNSDMSTQQK